MNKFSFRVGGRHAKTLNKTISVKSCIFGKVGSWLGPNVPFRKSFCCPVSDGAVWNERHVDVLMALNLSQTTQAKSSAFAPESHFGGAEAPGRARDAVLHGRRRRVAPPPENPHLQPVSRINNTVTAKHHIHPDSTGSQPDGRPS